jgi:hypothetical protein
MDHQEGVGHKCKAGFFAQEKLTATRRNPPPGCAPAASGHVAAAPPKSVMNSRRLIASPEVQDKASYRLKLALWKGPRK